MTSLTLILQRCLRLGCLLEAGQGVSDASGSIGNALTQVLSINAGIRNVTNSCQLDILMQKFGGRGGSLHLFKVTPLQRPLGAGLVFLLLLATSINFCNLSFQSNLLLNISNCVEH